MKENAEKSVTEIDINKAFEKANDDYLRDALKRTYTERFQYATMLYKVQQTLKKATIVHKKMDK